MGREVAAVAAFVQGVRTGGAILMLSMDAATGDNPVR